jgi:hypothetical protein
MIRRTEEGKGGRGEKGRGSKVVPQLFEDEGQVFDVPCGSRD